MTVIDLPPSKPAARSTLRIELYDGAALAAARWPSIAADPELRMYVYQSREFLQIWMDTIGRAGRFACYLIVARDAADQPVFYLPLAIETKFNVRLLRFMDAGVADYNAPILAGGFVPSRHEFMALWADILAVLPNFDVIDLKKIASEVAGAFNPLTFLDCTPFGEDGHPVVLTGPREEMEARGSVVHMRRSLRRLARGLAKSGELRFIVNPPAVEAARVLESLLDLKRRKYARTKVPDFLAAPGVECFYRAMAAPGLLGQLGHLSALAVGDAIVSAHLGFIGRGRFYYVFPAYDRTYQRNRVGLLLLQHLIDETREQKFTVFDLGIGDSSYKDTWATDRLALYRHERPVTARGRLYVQMRRVQRFIRAMRLRATQQAGN